MAENLGKGEDLRQFPRTATDEFLFSQFKGKVLARESTASTGAGVTTALQNNPERVGFLISNSSAGTVTLGFSRTITSGNGMVLGANGGFLRMSILEDGAPTGWELFMVGSGGGLSLYILEFIRYAARKGD